VGVVASNYPEEGRSANEGGDEPAKLPFRSCGSDHPAYTEARAEVRDRETYYAELRFAVHCQSRSIPVPRTAPDDLEPGTRTRGGSTDDEIWAEMVARFGDTWT
jgi:hypothetical protein